MVKTTTTGAKSSIPSKKYVDRELATKTTFEPTSVEILTSRTMILLLASAEDVVLLKALSTLDHYASKMEQNVVVLFEEGVLKPLIPLLSHQDLFVKRFTTKLMSELTFLPQVAHQLRDDQLIATIINLLIKEDDAVVKEFTLSIIAELTRAKRGLDQLIETQLVHIFCPLLAHTDPDIQKNCLQVIYNLLEASINHSMITSQEGYNVKFFSELMMSEYMAIQNLALDVMNTLIRGWEGKSVANQFKEVGGIQRVFSILKKYEWKDIHAKCLDMLFYLYEYPWLAEQAFKDGVLLLFSYMDLIGDTFLRGKALEVISKVTQVPEGRKMLVNSGQVGLLGSMILDPSPHVSTAACHTTTSLVQDYSALQLVLSLKIPTDLLTVMASDSRDWTNRGAAISALHQILIRDSDTCTSLSESEHKDIFATILGKFNEGVPISVPIAAANCVTALASNPSLRLKIITPSLISGLLCCFQNLKEDTTPLKLAACEALCSLVCEARARDLLRAQNGAAVVWNSLASATNLQLLQSAATFVHLSVTSDPSLTDSLVKLGVVKWLLSRSSLRYECPAWEMALESVFAKFLPIKFALTGRLDLTDTTENGFYITRAPLTRHELQAHEIPILSDIIAKNSCPMHLIYVANFNCKTIPLRGSWNVTSSRLKGSAVSLRSDSKSIQSLESWTSMNSCDKFRQNDNHLVTYIEDVKKMLQENGFSSKDKRPGSGDGVEDDSTVRKKVELIGQYVAQRMSGLERGVPCSSHCLHLHINELKMELMNSVIPVGCLRVGLHLERALLFKVLADRVGLPAGLVRGKGRGWVEVALPNLPPPPRPALPNHLLRPNHVVDLMNHPGTLYPLRSYDADLYCGFDTNP